MANKHNSSVFSFLPLSALGSAVMYAAMRWHPPDQEERNSKMTNKRWAAVSLSFEIPTTIFNSMRHSELWAEHLWFPNYVPFCEIPTTIFNSVGHSELWAEHLWFPNRVPFCGIPTTASLQ
jgi:hypothetical protein